MRVGLAQIRPRLGRVDFNIKLHQQWIEQAKKEQVDLLVFPELSLTGYNLLDLTFEVERNSASKDLDSLIRQADGIDIVFGFVESNNEHILYNSAVYASQKQLQYIHRKVYLPTYGMFDEARYFGQGRSIRSFLTSFGKCGIMICEDFWHSSTTYLLTQDGAQIMIVPSNSPSRGITREGITAQKRWYTVLKSQATLHGSYILFSNRVGTEDGISFFGGSAVIDPNGEIEKNASLFEEELLIVDLNLDKIKRARFQMPMLRDENIDLTIRELKRIHQEKGDY
jgi:predicted amidohydrolase